MSDDCPTIAEVSPSKPNVKFVIIANACQTAWRDNTKSKGKMKKNTFKVLFYVRGNRLNKDGQVSVMMRITVDGEMEQLNTKLTIDPKLWDVKIGRGIGRSAKVQEPTTLKTAPSLTAFAYEKCL